MTDPEILNYLSKRKFNVKAQEFLMDVLNTSPQIIDEKYDFNTKEMSIVTPNNKFSFKWSY